MRSELPSIMIAIRRDEGIPPYGVQATVDAVAQRIAFDSDCQPAG